MIRVARRKIRRVLIDVDTQIDLIFSNGNDPSSLLRRFRRLVALARLEGIPIISTTRAIRPANTNGHSSAHCVEGTNGQHKIGYTTLADRIVFGTENRMDLPRHLLNDHQQIIFEKRSLDPFDNPRADRLLTDVKADEFIVFGMSLDTAVAPTVLGLLLRGKHVLLVTDAVDIKRGRDALITLRKIEAKGAKLVQSEAIVGPSRLTGAPRLVRLYASVPTAPRTG